MTDESPKLPSDSVESTSTLCDEATRFNTELKRTVDEAKARAGAVGGNAADLHAIRPKPRGTRRAASSSDGRRTTRDAGAESLLREVLMAASTGMDFPTVWQRILRLHPLVAGSAVQRAEDGRLWLEVPLMTDQYLVHDGEGGYRLRSR